MGRNTTIVRSNYLWDETSFLYEHAMKLWEGLSQELNFNLMFSQRGVLNLCHNLQELRDTARRVNSNKLNGIDAELLNNSPGGGDSPHSEHIAEHTIPGARGFLPEKGWYSPTRRRGLGLRPGC